jgi:tRNA A37 threonylcarbamoyladenosine modification protein TsaB
MALAVAPAVADPATVICATLDAGRGEVYGALFAAGGPGVARLTPDRAWRPGDLAARLPPGAVVTGDGAAAMGAAGAGARRVEAPPLAPAIAARVRGLLPEGAGYRSGGVGPNYVRPADAEASRKRT